MKNFNHITIRFSLLLFISSLILPILFFPVAVITGYFSSKKFYEISKILEKVKFFMPSIVIAIYASMLFILFITIGFISDPNGFEEMLFKSVQIVEESGLYNSKQIQNLKSYLSNSTTEILLTYCIFFTLLSLILTTIGGYVSYLKCKLKHERTTNVE